MPDDTSGALAHSIPMAARRLGVSTKVLCGLIARGEIPIVEIADKVLIADVDQRALLDRHRRAVVPEAA